MNKQESYKTCMILMISSDGNQNNVFFLISARYRSPFCQVFGSPLSASLIYGDFGSKFGPNLCQKMEKYPFLEFPQNCY